jgi:hypothetical protein
MRIIMPRISLLLICCFIGGLLRASAQDDMVMKAMRDELDRSMKQLRLERLDKPYFIAYRVSDRTDSVIAATLGGLTSNQQSCRRLLTVEVRVGDYVLDNTNFISFNFGPAGVVHGFGNTVRLPLEIDYKEIRRQIWLATDSAYKKALEDLARKRAALENKTRGDDLPDFSKEDRAMSHEQPASIVQFAIEMYRDSGMTVLILRSYAREVPRCRLSKAFLETWFSGYSLFSWQCPFASSGERDPSKLRRARRRKAPSK